MRITISLAVMAAMLVMNACSDPPKDSDNDGIADEWDNCPYLRNQNQQDQDNDGFGDLCDECPRDRSCVYHGVCGECYEPPTVAVAADAGVIEGRPDAGVVEARLEPIQLFLGRSTSSTVMRDESVETIEILALNNNSVYGMMDALPIYIDGAFGVTDIIGVWTADTSGAICGQWAGFQDMQLIGGPMELNGATCLLPPNATAKFYVNVFVSHTASAGATFRVKIKNPELARAHTLETARRELHVLYDDIVSADFTISSATSSTLGVDPEIIFYRDPMQPPSRIDSYGTMFPVDMLVIRANNQSITRGIEEDALIYSFAVKGEGDYLPSDVTSLVVFDNRLDGPGPHSPPIYEYDMPLSDEITTISFAVPRPGQDASSIKVPWANSNEMAFTVAIRLSPTARVGSTIKLRAIPESFLVRGPEGRRFEKVFLDELVGNSITIGPDNAQLDGGVTDAGSGLSLTMGPGSHFPCQGNMGMREEGLLGRLFCEIKLLNNTGRTGYLRSFEINYTGELTPAEIHHIVVFDDALLGGGAPGASHVAYYGVRPGTITIDMSGWPIRVHSDWATSISLFMSTNSNPHGKIFSGTIPKSGLQVYTERDFSETQQIFSINGEDLAFSWIFGTPIDGGVADAGQPPTLSPCILPLQHGALFKGSLSAVYYYASNGKKYVFPNDKTYKSWYSDFSTVCQMSDAELAPIMIGGNVTYRPGSALLKIASDPAVYAVARYGVLRRIMTEQVAADIYGTNWNAFVQDLPDVFFLNYTVGAEINSSADYNRSEELANSRSVECVTAHGAGYNCTP